MAFHSFAAVVVKDAASRLTARELSASVRLEQVTEDLEDGDGLVGLVCFINVCLSIYQSVYIEARETLGPCAL